MITQVVAVSLEIQGKELVPMSLSEWFALANLIVNLIGLAYRILKDG